MMMAPFPLVPPVGQGFGRTPERDQCDISMAHVGRAPKNKRLYLSGGADSQSLAQYSASLQAIADQYSRKL